MDISIVSFLAKLMQNTPIPSWDSVCNKKKKKTTEWANFQILYDITNQK